MKKLQIKKFFVTGKLHLHYITLSYLSQLIYFLFFVSNDEISQIFRLIAIFICLYIEFFLFLVSLRNKFHIDFKQFEFHFPNIPSPSIEKEPTINLRNIDPIYNELYRPLVTHYRTHQIRIIISRVHKSFVRIYRPSHLHQHIRYLAINSCLLLQLLICSSRTHQRHNKLLSLSFVSSLFPHTSFFRLLSKRLPKLYHTLLILSSQHTIQVFNSIFLVQICERG